MGASVKRNRMNVLPLLGFGVVVLFSALLAACGGDDEPDAQPLNVLVASYELIAENDNRFIAGVLTMDQRLVAFGDVGMEFSYLGTGEGSQEPETFTEMTATFLAIPGTFTGEPPADTVLAEPSEGTGVYAAEPVRFDRAGFWQVEVTAEIDGTSYSGVSAFQVLDEAQVPAIGEQAPASENNIIGSDARPQAIDSRATSQEDVPDPELHQLTIAEALEQDRPLVVVFSTPVFCVSQFCGPITDLIQEVQAEYGDQANFIHVEIWSNFQEQAITRAAADWLLRNNNLQEPWVFLVDSSGVIVDRWDNVITREELVSALEEELAS